MYFYCVICSRRMCAINRHNVERYWRTQRCASAYNAVHQDNPRGVSQVPSQVLRYLVEDQCALHTCIGIVVRYTVTRLVRILHLYSLLCQSVDCISSCVWMVMVDDTIAYTDVDTTSYPLEFIINTIIIIDSNSNHQLCHTVPQ